MIVAKTGCAPATATMAAAKSNGLAVDGLSAGANLLQTEYERTRQAGAKQLVQADV